MRTSERTTMNADTNHKSLNIVLYSNSFLPQVGGREIVVYHLANALTKAGHYARVVCPGGWWSQRKLKYPFPVHRWPSFPGLSFELSSRINLAIDIARNGCDVVNAHATYPAGYIALKNKAFNHLPLIITPHGEDIHVIPEIGHGLRLDPEIEPLINQVVNSAERLTAISGSVVASLQNASAPAGKIVEIPNGVDFDRFRNDSVIDIRARYKIPADKKLILTVGSYVRRRGHEELVEAMQAIHKADNKAHLVVVGRGTEILKPMIKALNIEDAVTLTGQVPPIEADLTGEDLVAAFYLASDVYVAPGMSEGSEGLSLALLDAMAAGSAIVATRISGNRDVIVDEQNGLLVDPGNPGALAEGVKKMLSNKTLRESCKRQAVEDVRPYSWDSIADQYVQCYRDAMNNA